MADIPFHVKEFDSDELHKQLKEQLGDKFNGLSFTNGGESVIIHLTGEQPADVNKAMLTYAAHDVATLPPKVAPKSLEERLADLETEVTTLKAKNAALTAQVAKG